MTNVWYVKCILAKCILTVMETCIFLILHLPGVELRSKLQEKLHRVTGPLDLKDYVKHVMRITVR